MNVSSNRLYSFPFSCPSFALSFIPSFLHSPILPSFLLFLMALGFEPRVLEEASVNDVSAVLWLQTFLYILEAQGSSIFVLGLLEYAVVASELTVMYQTLLVIIRELHVFLFSGCQIFVF